MANVHAVSATIEMIPDFGGVLYRWTNENNSPLAFLVYATDTLGKLSHIETVYSGITDGKYNVRGYEPEEKEFAILVRDRWDNFSDTAKVTVTPMFEQELDKTKFNKVILDTDQSWDAWGAKYERTFDGNINNFNHTYAGTGWPQYLTVDLGVVARLSRVVVHQRLKFKYRHGNPRLMDIWGIKETPEQDGRYDGWHPLRVAPENGCVALKPSQEGGTAEEDAQHVLNGDEYTFSLDDPPVRYIRFVVNETWGNTGFSHMGEITFFGQVVEEL